VEQPKLVTAHGEKVWANEKMDALRREECLCANCASFEDCFAAKVLYFTCVHAGIALAVTRCRNWKEK